MNESDNKEILQEILKQMLIQNAFKTSEIIAVTMADSVTFAPEFSINSLIYVLEGTIAAGTSQAWYIPFSDLYIITGDWLDIDVEGQGLVEVSYYRDYVPVFKVSRNCKTPVFSSPVYKNVTVSIKNNDTINHKFSILWHYSLAKKRVYESFVTGISAKMENYIQEIAEGKI